MLQVIKALNKCVFPEIVKDIDVDYLGSDGRRYKFSYASLPKILNAVVPELKKNGLRISQMTSGNGVKTYLFHESGECICEESNPDITYSNIQDWGGSITYQRRYAIVAMLGLVSEDDQDGKTINDNTTEMIGGKPKLDESRYNAMVNAVIEGKHKEVMNALKKYSATYTQIEELNKLINEKKLDALKKSTK
jgi:hypothetical protein